MGCDIHLFIEHKDKQYNHWEGFGGKINPGRNYDIFTRLCGVRNYQKEEPITFPRGLPEDISWRANDENTLFIDDSCADNDGHCSKKQADEWVKQGYSKRVSEHRITHPDWHSHSWATAEELEKALTNSNYVDSEWTAVLIVLKHFESLGEEARIVFWFDN